MNWVRPYKLSDKIEVPISLTEGMAVILAVDGVTKGDYVRSLIETHLQLYESLYRQLRKVLGQNPQATEREGERSLEKYQLEIPC